MSEIKFVADGLGVMIHDVTLNREIYVSNVELVVLAHWFRNPTPVVDFRPKGDDYCILTQTDDAQSAVLVREDIEMQPSQGIIIFQDRYAELAEFLEQRYAETQVSSD